MIYEVSYMNYFCLSELNQLMVKGEGPHISIYMPTHYGGGEDPQDPVRLKNLLRLAEEKLIARGVRGTEAKRLLIPAEKLLQDNLFWRQQAIGLGLFISSTKTLYYHLPLKPDEIVVVADRFHIKSLVPLLGECGTYYVLALSQNAVRFWQCSRFNSVQIPLEGVPRNLAEALHVDVPDSRTQSRTGGPVAGGKGTSAFYGTGSGASYDKANIIQYFEQIDRSLHQTLRNEKSPLVLAAVDYLVPLFKQASKYAHILPEAIIGNPDGLADDKICGQAWSLVKPYYEKSAQDALGQYRQSAGTGLTSTEIGDILWGAHNGQIRFLFTFGGAARWGKFSATNGETIIHSQALADDDDLIEIAVWQTIAHDGMIYFSEAQNIPDGGPLSAVFRFWSPPPLKA
jgi:hypothetical protein